MWYAVYVYLQQNRFRQPRISQNSSQWGQGRDGRPDNCKAQEYYIYKKKKHEKEQIVCSKIR